MLLVLLLAYIEAQFILLYDTIQKQRSRVYVVINLPDVVLHHPCPTPNLLYIGSVLSIHYRWLTDIFLQ